MEIDTGDCFLMGASNTTSAACVMNDTSLVNRTSPLPGNSSDIDNIPYTLPWWRQILWSVFFGGIVIVGTGGNLIVMWIVLAHKRMRTVTNYFLVNLSIADAMVSTLNVTFNYTYMLNNDWPFGETYCKITQFVAVLSICASVFTLMAISIDR
ncbi:tachykinin-like peptides receptor 99D [Schistocerca nitens]|uniref:tachykinin-like peptides receptor 99D n=1 Tax=Schistocerca nitens TaxID=7011 RepID=UPI00211973D2|nr:tachykinin-like peptides receptor 99D [Schistocerca nitens]